MENHTLQSLKCQQSTGSDKANSYRSNNDPEVCLHNELSQPSMPKNYDIKSLSKMKWIRKEKIGQGAQGTVYRCEDAASMTESAVKIIQAQDLSEPELELIKREVKTMKRLKYHPHIVQYYKATEKPGKQLAIYMEYVAGGSLASYIRKHGALSICAIRDYTKQLCHALQFLHRNRIAHRDVKCANVFMSEDLSIIKLGDFGTFKEIGRVSLVGGIKGTPHWMAPEVIRENGKCNDGDSWFQADIWSLGCAILEMLTGHSPWQQYSNPLTAMFQIVTSSSTPSIPSGTPDDLTNFLQACLQRNPSDRWPTKELLKHNFLNESKVQSCANPAIDNRTASSSETLVYTINNKRSSHEKNLSKQSAEKLHYNNYTFMPMASKEAVETCSPHGQEKKAFNPSQESKSAKLNGKAAILYMDIHEPEATEDPISPRINQNNNILIVGNTEENNNDHETRSSSAAYMRDYLPHVKGSTHKSSQLPPTNIIIQASNSIGRILSPPHRVVRHHLRRVSTAPPAPARTEINDVLEFSSSLKKHTLPPLSVGANSRYKSCQINAAHPLSSALK